IHLRGDGDAGNPTGQERIEIESVGDVVAGGADARQRTSQDVIDRIGGHHTEVILRHSGGAKGVRIETGVQPSATHRQRVASLDPVQIVGELVDGVIAHVCSHVRNPGIDQGRIDNAVTLIGKAVRVGVNKKILAVALDAEDHAVYYVPLD